MTTSKELAAKLPEIPATTDLGLFKLLFPIHTILKAYASETDSGDTGGDAGDVTGGVATGDSVITQEDTAGVAIKAGQLVAILNGTARLASYDANPAVGIATADAAVGEPIKLLTAGKLTITGLNLNGRHLYLGKDGALTFSPVPAASGKLHQIVATILSSSTVHFFPFPSILRKS